MVNKLFVASTTRNKMQPEKSLGVGWDSLKFSFHSLTALLLPIMLSHQAFSPLYLVSEEYSITHNRGTCRRLPGPQCDRMRRQPATAINGHHCDYDLKSLWIAGSAFWFYRKLKISLAEKYPDSREKHLRGKTIRIQKFSDPNFPFLNSRFKISGEMSRHDQTGMFSFRIRPRE